MLGLRELNGSPAAKQSSGLPRPPVGHAWGFWCEGAQVGGDLDDLFVGERATECQNPRQHLGIWDAAGNEAVNLVVGGALEELFGVEHWGAATDRTLSVACRAVGREQLSPDDLEVRCAAAASVRKVGSRTR
jgi:hypothetical protein